MNLTCIICPKGCSLHVEPDASSGDLRVTGNACPRGVQYALKEATNPERTVTSSARVLGGTRPLVPVKTLNPIPKADIPATLQAIRNLSLQAPITLGDTLLPNIVATDSVPKAP